MVEGTLPVGGLSSSAAVIITYINAFYIANHIHITKSEIISTAIWAEHNYIGIRVGKLDQNCEVYCKKDSLLYLETKDDSTEIIPLSDMKYGKYQDAFLRDVPYGIFCEYKDRLSENRRKRTSHFYTEQQHVKDGVKAWRTGNLEKFGQLMFASGRSSIENYETRYKGSCVIHGIT